MKTTETISYISIAVIVVSLFFIGTELTGFVTEGIVNVTIETSASINFTTALLDLGNGTVTPGQAAIVSSDGSGAANQFWTGNQATGELVIENNGNVNVSLDLRADEEAATFIGGSSGQEFAILVAENESGSCASITSYSTYTAITTADLEACSELGTDEAANSLTIDARLTIPDDSITGELDVQVMATATVV